MIIESHRKILEFLGLKDSDCITKLNLKVDAIELPRLTIERVINNDDLKPVESNFVLVDKDKYEELMQVIAELADEQKGILINKMEANQAFSELDGIPSNENALTSAQDAVSISR